MLDDLLDGLRVEGFRSVRTGAVPTSGAVLFLAAGFATRETLHLLERPLGRTERPGRPTIRTRTARAADRGAILGVDARSFGFGWRFDAQALADTESATPVARTRVVECDDRVRGYAVTGLGGSTGYVQRLAVDPDVRRRGLARALLADSLRWQSRRGATRSLVNTQVGNDAALALYLAAGFDLLPRELTVFERAL
jgi:ribosomal-protein-alanine N-acetyltransferase